MNNEAKGVIMIHIIEFASDKFSQNRNIMKELTRNTIIICDSSEIKNTISENLRKGFTTNENEDELIRYFTTYEGDIVCNHLMEFPQTSIFKFSPKKRKRDFTQRIIVTVENAFVFQVKNLYDLWFAHQWDDKIYLEALTEYESYEKFHKSPIMLYKALSVGRFSTNGKYGR